jgi:hypothetical protein
MVELGVNPGAVGGNRAAFEILDKVCEANGLTAKQLADLPYEAIVPLIRPLLGEDKPIDPMALAQRLDQYVKAHA